MSEDTGSYLTAGQITRAEVLLRLGESDVVSADERQFIDHTEWAKWEQLWAVGSYCSGGDRRAGLARFTYTQAGCKATKT